MPLSFVPSPSTSTSEDDEMAVLSFPLDRSMSPTQLLAVAIKKRRSLAASKERDLRLELLHTGIIQSLCKHLGEGRAKRRRRGGKKRSASAAKRGLPSAFGEQPVQTPSDEQEPPLKRPRNDDEDPFGLDELFRKVYGRSRV